MALGKRTRRALFSTPSKKKARKAFLYSGSGPIVPRSLKKRTEGVTHKISRMVQWSAPSISGGDTLAAMSFKLSDVPNAGEFTSLFDEYKIEAVKVHFVPTHNSSTEAATGSKKIPYLITATDNDDATAPASIGVLLQKESAKVHGMFDQMRVRTVKPMASMALYNGATTGYGSYSGFLDTASPDIPHYGLKYLLGAVPVLDEFQYFIYCTYYISFRKVT